VSRGGKYISLSLAEKLAYELDGDTEKAPHETLSDREYQILLLIASGKTVSDIAGEMCLSVKTVSTYRARILDKMKLEAGRREQACPAAFCAARRLSLTS